MPGDSASAADFGPARFDAADEIVRSYFHRGVAPAISYGIVRDGEIVHAASFGGVTLLGAAPDERTVFRIASMSKSFTASAIMLLRDAGALSAGRPGGGVRAGAGRLGQRGGGRRPADDQAAAHHDRRLPDRRPVGRPAAGAAGG